MSNLRITAGPFSFTARFEEEKAPKTVAAFIDWLVGSSGWQVRDLQDGARERAARSGLTKRRRP